MRILFFLLCTLPVFSLAQAPSNAPAQQHEQAVQQLQQQLPQATIVDLNTLAAQQKQDQRSCTTCAQKAALSAKSSTAKKTLASEQDLLAEQAHLGRTIQQLRQAATPDQDLLLKYLRALELNAKELQVVQAHQVRTAKTAKKRRQLGQ